MKMKKSKDEDGKYRVTKQLRLTSQMAELVEAKALERHTTDSEIIRQAVSNYVNRSMSDVEIVHASLSETSRKIRYLENKVELLALVVFEQTKMLMKSVPNRAINSDAVVKNEFEKFMRGVTKTLKTNHTGVLEAMILDSYEQGSEEG